MKKKIKLKKKFKITLAVFILIMILGIWGFNTYQNYKYEQTYEFKFLNAGYTIDEYNILNDNFDDKKLDEFLKSEYDEVIFDLLNEKYYLSKNFDKYYNYYKENDYLELSYIISYINVGLDSDFYDNVSSADTSKNELMLVNKYSALDKDYVPDNLVTIKQDYSWGTYGSQKLNEITWNAFLNMWNMANNEGIYLMVSSSYRSFTEQEEVYNSYASDRGEKYADGIAARPGHSEHQTGLSIDILSLDSPVRSEFAKSTSYTWLIDNAHKYGFILRYPEDRTEITGYSYESWHYRYVGIDTATYIYENDITFDEYYAYYEAN